MKEIWHTTCEPNYSSLVIVIDQDDKVFDFGFYKGETIRPGDRWAYMTDLVNNTTKNK